MGAQEFVVSRKKTGQTASEAFSDARAGALYDYGHRGYTGSIAEKAAFKMLPVVEGKTAEESAWHYLDEDHLAIRDKWGPAGCIEAEDKYVFFGLASA